MRKRNRIFKCLSLIGILTPYIVSSQSKDIVENDSLILWQENRMLEWNDFKGKQLDFHGNVLAETHGDIVILSKKRVDYVPIIKIGTYFKKYSSWTITEDVLSLNHEQIHFDIYELFTRKIREAFCKLNDEGNIDLEKYEEAFNEFIEENNRYNELYDVDVLTNQSKQKEWRLKVTKELEELKEYEYIPEE